MPTIKFTDDTGLVPEMYYPKPSKMVIPEWFKKLAPEFDYKTKMDGPGGTKAVSGKRCIPMLDAMTIGYTLFTSEDIRVTRHEGLPYYEWARRDEAISFHDHKQLSTHPEVAGGQNIPKWNSPWIIKTPPGYSCLFVPPLNNPETPIKIFSGVVDTDTYIDFVHLPFLLVDKSFEGTIPAGSPIAQVIPFRRDSWKMEINTISKEEISKTVQKRESMFFERYKKLFWFRKEFS